MAISIDLSCLLVNADVIDLEAGGKLGLRGIAAILRANGQVQDHVVRLPEWILPFFVAVECLADINRVQQQAVDWKLDGALVPIHPTDVELLRPLRIVE